MVIWNSLIWKSGQENGDLEVRPSMMLDLDYKYSMF